jgi:hypothetical protein
MLSRIEKLILAVVLVLLLVGMGLSHYDHALFREAYVIEDGFIEWLTVFGLVLCAGACGYRVVTLWGQKKPLFIAVLAFMTAVFLFGAGEEISWGQRILNIETSEFFEQHNAQGEMNLHNLRVNGVKINKIIFAKGLGIAFLLYLAVLTPLYRKKAAVRRFLDRLAFPVPQNYQIIAYVLVLLIVEGLTDSSKRGEMTEFAIVFVVYLNLMYPGNKALFSRQAPITG